MPCQDFITEDLILQAKPMETSASQKVQNDGRHHGGRSKAIPLVKKLNYFKYGLACASRKEEMNFLIRRAADRNLIPNLVSRPLL